MKNVNRFLIFVLMLILCVSVMTIPTFAATASQDGLDVNLSTDKIAYEAGEEITVTLTVTNTNDTDVEDVSLEILTPNGYVLADGEEAEKEVEALAYSESETLEVTYTANDSLSNTSDENVEISDAEGTGSSYGSDDNTSSTDSNASTGDYSNTFFWLFMSGLGFVVILVIVSRKKIGKNLFSLFLCLAIAGLLPINLSLTAEATEVKENTISISENVTVDSTDLEISAVIGYGDVANSGTEDQDTDTELTGLPRPENPTEADEYYWDNSTVLEVISADESSEMMSEAEVSVFLAERGFDDYQIYYEYLDGGERCEETEITNSSTEKHPMYWTYYVSESDELWTIMVVNGSLFANPVSFNLESDLDAQLLVAESEILVSYDNEDNKFYVNIPYETAVIVKKVNVIDAQTFDDLTAEEVGEL